MGEDSGSGSRGITKPKGVRRSDDLNQGQLGGGGRGLGGDREVTIARIGWKLWDLGDQHSRWE